MSLLGGLTEIKSHAVSKCHARICGTGQQDYIQILFSKELRIATDLQSHNLTSIRIYIRNPYNFGKVLSTWGWFLIKLRGGKNSTCLKLSFLPSFSLACLLCRPPFLPHSARCPGPSWSTQPIWTHLEALIFFWLSIAYQNLPITWLCSQNSAR